jgi:MFS family permease
MSNGNLTGVKRIFRTLRYRNYRLFFSGQLISLIGTWMQQVAVIWLVYRMTNSAFLLGLVGFGAQIPMFLLSPFAGVIADRFNRHRIIIVTQSLAMLQATILTVLMYTGSITIWQIIILMIFLGCINAFDMPTRQSFVLEMVENKEDLGNAIALNSSMFNGARLLGPSIAGIMIATVGEAACFLLNAISFIAVIAALLAMRLPKKKRILTSHSVMEGFKEGFRYVYSFRPIRYILLLLAVVSIVGIPFTVLMPIFAKDILHGGPHTLGFLMGAHGVGALIGAFTLASRKSVRGLAKWIGIAAIIFGTSLCAFSLSQIQLVSMLLLMFAGFGMMVQMASSNTILQTISDDDKRGRVISFYTIAFAGMTPFGSLLAGSMASMAGAPATILVSGIICVIAALIFYSKLPVLRKEIRPIYMKIGIIEDLPPEFETPVK